MINWLQKWYRGHCNGDWEHLYGVHIDTLDNPGWIILIDLADTELENITIQTVAIENSNSDWLQYSITDNTFKAAGDPSKLEQMISIFKEIVEKYSEL